MNYNLYKEHLVGLESDSYINWPSPSDIPLPSYFQSLSLSLLSPSSSSLASRQTERNASKHKLDVTQIERAINEYLSQEAHHTYTAQHRTICNNSINSVSSKRSKLLHSKSETSPELVKPSHENELIKEELHYNNNNNNNKKNISNTQQVGHNRSKGKRFTSPEIDNRDVNVQVHLSRKQVLQQQEEQEEEEQLEEEELHCKSKECVSNKRGNAAKWNSSCKVDRRNEHSNQSVNTDYRRMCNNYNSNNNNNNNNNNSNNKRKQTNNSSRVNRSVSTLATSSLTPSCSSVERQSSDLLSTAQHYVQEIEQMYNALKQTFNEVESKRQQLIETNKLAHNPVNSEEEKKETAAAAALATTTTTTTSKAVEQFSNNKCESERVIAPINKKFSVPDVTRQPVMTKAKRAKAIQLQEHLANLQRQWNRLQVLNTQNQYTSHERKHKHHNKNNYEEEKLLHADNVHALIQERRSALHVENKERKEELEGITSCTF